jgi:hypothetical protein
LLNPPTCGLLLATALVVVVHRVPGWLLRSALAIVMFVALSLTLARGAFLLVAVGIGLPLLSRVLGRLMSFLLLTGAAVVVAGALMGQGGSALHVRGFVDGVRQAVAAPLGSGFGHFGNAAGNLGGVDHLSGESLIGIVGSAIGLPGLALVALLVVVLCRRLVRAPADQVWLIALALAAVVASAFSETASALNATIALWLLAGRALAPRASTEPGVGDDDHVVAFDLTSPSDHRERGHGP